MLALDKFCNLFLYALYGVFYFLLRLGGSKSTSDPGLSGPLLGVVEFGGEKGAQQGSDAVLI